MDHSLNVPCVFTNIRECLTVYVLCESLDLEEIEEMNGFNQNTANHGDENMFFLLPLIFLMLNQRAHKVETMLFIFYILINISKII